MKRTLITCFLLAALIGVMFPFPQPVSAQTGSISGYVYESGTTTGIAGAIVSAYVHMPGPLPIWETPNGQDTTDGSGYYEITELPIGNNYRVAAVAAGHERIIYPDKHLLIEGDQVTVPSENIDFYLGPGGTISGTVTGDDGVTAIPDVSVVATLSSIKGAYCIDLTDGNGDYILDGLPYGSYAVSAPGVAKPGTGDDGYIIEYWQEKLITDPPDSVDINAGQNLVENIDFTLTVGGTVSGYVHETDGTTPITNAMVQAFVYDSLAGGWILRGLGITKGDGYYQTTGLPEGEYGLRARMTALNYASEWYLETPYKDNATPVPVNVPGDTSGKNFTLEMGGAISGIVTDESQNPIGNCHVFATDYDTDMWLDGVNTKGDGTYILTGLPVGSYRVRTAPQNTGLPYVGEYYNDTYDHGQAQAVVVSSGQTKTDINFELAPGGSISGTVYDDATDEPAANVSVECLPIFSPGGWGATTDENGNYTIYGLPYGDYHVRSPGGGRWGLGDGNYILQYWDHLFYPPHDQVTVESGGNPTGIDFHLVTGDSIAGTVTDESLNPIANCHVFAEEAVSYVWLSGANTDSNGDYTLFGLIPGTDLRLKAAPSETGLPYADEYYDGAYDIGDATLVQAPNTDINFTLGPPLNNVWAGFFTTYNYNTDGNNYTYDSENPVYGNKSWSSQVHNWPDDTGEPVDDPIARLIGPDDFDWMKAWPENNHTYAGGIHQWAFNDLNEFNGMGVDVGYNEPVSFNPPFDIIRSIEPTTLSGNKNDVKQQTLTVTVTPKAVMDQMNINVNVWDDGLVTPVVTSVDYSVNGSPGPIPGVDLNSGPNDVNMSVSNPVIDSVYALIVNLDVTLKDDFTSIDYMPWVQVTKQTNLGGGTTDSSETWQIYSEVGDWQWLATGIYTWKMGVFEHENVIFNSTQRNNVSVGFATHYDYNVDGDSYTYDAINPVDGSKNWDTKMDNSSDDTGAPIDDPIAALIGPDNFDWMDAWPENDYSYDSGTHQWNFRDIHQFEGSGVNVGYHTPVQFYPGFDVTRSIDPLTLSGNKDDVIPQTLTVTVTPRVSMQHMNIYVNARDDGLVSPVITSIEYSVGGVPGPVEGVYTNYDGNHAHMGVPNPVIDTVFVFTVFLDVTLKDDFASIDHMPQVRVSKQTNLDSGITVGSGTPEVTNEAGTWSWSATGVYAWDWVKFEFEDITLNSTQRDSAWADFSTNYGCSISGDSFTNQQVNGWKSWSIHTKSENGFTSLMVALNSSLAFNWMDPEPTTSDPPNYSWSFGDTPPGQGTGVNIGGPFPVDYTPGLDITREIDPLVLTESGDQTLTIIVTPREAMDGLGVGVNVNEDSLMIPSITSASIDPNPGANIWISPDGRNLNIHIPGPAIDQSYTCTVTTHVELNAGVSSVEHMPWVQVNHSNSIANGTDIGGEVSRTIADMGDWTISATGTYAWQWDESLNKGIQLEGTQRNNAWVGFNTNYGYQVSGDSFTSQQVTGGKGWSAWLKSEQGLTSLTTILNSSLSFDWMDPAPTSSNPPIYQWDLGNIPPGHDTGVNINSGTADFTPDFNVTREITPRMLSESGDQTLTITVTPLEAMDGLSVEVKVNEDSSMIPSITSATVDPDPGAGIWLDPNGWGANIYLSNPTILQLYTYTLTIHVELKEGVSLVEHMPWVNIRQGNILANGTLTGSEVSRSITDLGDWTITASGDYTWNWDESIFKIVEMQRTQFTNVWAGFNTNYSYSISGDSFTNQQVTGWKGWRAEAKSPDNFTSLAILLNSGLSFEWMNAGPQYDYNYDGSTHSWSFGDVNGAWVDVGSGAFEVDYTPGFNVTRDINPRLLYEPGNQTLSIIVTPVEAMQGLGVNVNVNEDSFIIPNIISASVDPNLDADIRLSPDGKNLNIRIPNPTIDQPYICTVAIYVDFKGGTNSAEHMPWVTVNQLNLVANGITTGSEVSHGITGMGDWTITASGTYIWNWNAALVKSIHLEGTQHGNLFQVSINAPDKVPPGSEFTATVDISPAGIAYEPMYGGVLNIAYMFPPSYFDEAMGSVFFAPTLYLTNEELMMGDWTKGPAGSNEATWLYSPLFPTPNTLTGCLAESWEMPDSQTLVFHLRTGVHFQNKPPVNGRELIADDVVYSLIRLWTTPTSLHYMNYPWVEYFQDLDGGPWIKALNNYTIEIKCLPGKLSAVYEMIGDQSKIIAPEVQDPNDWHNAVGTGPFVLTDYIANISATFVRSPGYWMNDPLCLENKLPYLDGVNYLFIPDFTTRLAALRTGNIDLLHNVQWQDAQSLMITNPELKYLRYLPAITMGIFMRLDKPELPFDDIRVRRAIAMAIDYQAIINQYYGGNAEIMASPIAPVKDFMDMYTPFDQMPESVQKLFTYNPEKAKQLLADAGYPNGFQTSIVCNPTQVDMASIVQDFMAQIGIALEIDVVDMGAYFSIGINKTYDQMYMANLMDGAPLKLNQYRPGSQQNYSLIDDPVINEAIADIDAAYFNEPSRRQLMKDLVPYILDQAYVIQMPEPYVFNFWQPWLKGYHGELSVGLFNLDYARYIWMDQELKAAMLGGGGDGATIDGLDTTVQSGGVVATGSLNTAEYDIIFDPSVLQLIDITPGQVDSTEIPVQFTQTGPGTYHVVQSLGTGTVDGSGFLSVLHFQAADSIGQSSPIEFANGILSDLGGEIPAIWTGDSVQIESVVNLSIQPPEETVSVGETFSVTIQAEAGSQSVSGVSAFLDFDPAYLEVQSITPGATLPVVIWNTYDNVAGTIDYSAGKMGEPFPSGTFTVATIEFKALALASPSTTIDFSTTFPRETMVDFGGNDVTGILSGGKVFIADALVDISMVLQGGSRPDAGWVIPVTVKFFNPGANVLVDTPLTQFNLTTAKSGGTAVCQCSVEPGVYDITVVSEHTLINVRRNVTISLPSTAINMGTLLEGNANDDSIINISDFGILAVSFLKTTGQPGYDARADFDRNGIINISDFGLLAVNFMRTSPIEVP